MEFLLVPMHHQRARCAQHILFAGFTITIQTHVRKLHIRGAAAKVLLHKASVKNAPVTENSLFEMRISYLYSN